MEEKKYCYKYPHPAVTTDCVIFGFDGKRLHILLIERGLEPYKGSWALPGGFLKMDETVGEGAARELYEETHVKDVYLEQFKVFSTVDRDPRERVITVAFYALVRQTDYRILAGDDAARASWFEVDELPPLAFDHEEIIIQAREHLKDKLKVSPIAFRLLDEQFTMGDLQRVYELISGRSYDRRNFYRKALASGLLENESEKESIQDEADDDLTDCCMADYASAPKMEAIWTSKPRKGKTPTQIFRFNEQSFEEMDENESKRNPFDF